jgi:hypothetical protein
VHIFERGAIFKNSESGLEIQCSVLVADIFELNTDMKAMIMIDVDPNNYGFTDDSKTIEIMNNLQKCDIFNCEVSAVGNSFRCSFEDITIEADYGNGSVIRVYVKVDDYEHHECRPIHNNYDAMVEIMKDESVWEDLK